MWIVVCFSVLLHLAEDMAIEKKMKKHSIVNNLVQLLDADNPDLLSVVLLFLKKLSIIKENKDEMVILFILHFFFFGVNPCSRQIEISFQCYHGWYRLHRYMRGTCSRPSASCSTSLSVLSSRLRWQTLA